ncbi:hypothetical protein B0H13DRAFT_2405373 [Mycena leptocephala]|nr:hypothetical protein B0H13DRAFT_2405373 [Mycena leptocephala]
MPRIRFSARRIRGHPRNKARPKEKAGTAWHESGINPKPSNEWDSAGKNCAPTSSAVDAQSKQLPLSPSKKKTADRWKTKSGENSPTPAEPEVRRAGLERRGGGGGGEVYCGLCRAASLARARGARARAAERRCGVGVGWERRKKGGKGEPQEGEEGEEECVGSARSSSMRRAEAGSTAQRSQTLTSSTFGMEDLGPRTKNGFRAGWRGQGDGRMGELELLSVSS